LLTNFKNTFYEFGTSLHCFNESLDYHIVKAQNVPFGPYAGVNRHTAFYAAQWKS